MQVASLEESAAQARLEPQALNGTNDLRLSVHGNAAEGQALLAAVFDNLGKGRVGRGGAEPGSDAGAALKK